MCDPIILECPSEPFGVLSVPNPQLPVSEAGIATAYQALLKHFGVPARSEDREKDIRPVGSQIDKALALCLDRDRWALHEGHVEIVGSHGDRYRTSPEFCEGSEWSNRGRKTKVCKGSMRAAVGMCTHQLAIEMLRLAQQYTEVSTTEADPTALVTLPGWAVFALWGPLNVVHRKAADAPSDAVELLVEECLSLSSGGFTTTTTTCAITGVPTLITIPSAGFHDLWASLRPVALDIPTLSLAVHLLPDTTGTLTVHGGSFHETVPVSGIVL